MSLALISNRKRIAHPLCQSQILCNILRRAKRLKILKIHTKNLIKCILLPNKFNRLVEF